jgi:hypothetical protein
VTEHLLAPTEQSKKSVFGSTALLGVTEQKTAARSGFPRLCSVPPRKAATSGENLIGKPGEPTTITFAYAKHPARTECATTTWANLIGSVRGRKIRVRIHCSARCGRAFARSHRAEQISWETPF